MSQICSLCPNALSVGTDACYQLFHVNSICKGWYWVKLVETKVHSFILKRSYSLFCMEQLTVQSQRCIHMCITVFIITVLLLYGLSSEVNVLTWEVLHNRNSKTKILLFPTWFQVNSFFTAFDLVTEWGTASHSCKLLFGSCQNKAAFFLILFKNRIINLFHVPDPEKVFTCGLWKELISQNVLKHKALYCPHLKD